VHFYSALSTSKINKNLKIGQVQFYCLYRWNCFSGGKPWEGFSGLQNRSKNYRLGNSYGVAEVAG